MSKDYTNEIGYESLLKDFERYQKQTPKGVGMARKGQNIYLQFKTPNTARKPYACGCTFSLDGMVDALKKSNKVAEALKSLVSEVEFWDWYDKEIKQDSQLVDDRLTFGEAIVRVENDFWSRPDRRRRERDKNNPSDISSWDKAYGTFYRHLPTNKVFNLKDIQEAIKKYKKGSKTHKGAIIALKKLSRISKQKDILDYLSGLDITQTIFTELQTASLGDFLNWRDKALGITVSLHPNANIETRESWLWVFSMQVVFGLRISEVFAVKNLFESYTTKDKVVIPALNDPTNTTNLIYIGEKTTLGTTVKTGARIARPIISPKYPDLIERLDIKKPSLPTNDPDKNNPRSVRNFFCTTARRKLVSWNAPFTQTQALRHLANINGMQAGIPLEIRAQSMGHTPAMNDSVYKKRQSTQTTIDLLLNSNSQAIDFVTALASVKNLLKAQPENKDFAIELLSVIYQKDSRALAELL
ncbi:MAG: hypothetical protein HC764_08715 [Pleurocapsa sp. CRU_1_2]|nr:hypothetical protein [Pleurocapsa sp. CRU_1_2]